MSKVGRALGDLSEFTPSAALVASLETWYGREARDLPWRRSRDPYGIWISEAMLQQTRVETVRDYWVRFMERFPDLPTLAAAAEQDVLEAWSGLGYYRRARALHKAAQVIVDDHGGSFPTTRKAALALPGVGPYTAGAVLSIAFDQPEALVDGNVERVFARLFGLEYVTGSSALKAQAWERAGQLVVLAKSPGNWNQALMELGATLCTPRSPRCLLCPLQEHCQAQASGDPARLPLPKEKQRPTPVSAWMALVEADGQLLLEQRPPAGRMAGLWQLPTVERPGTGLAQGLFPVAWAASLELRILEELGSFRHGITRYALRVQVQRAEPMGAPALQPAGPFLWIPRAQAETLALTGMTKKALAMNSR